MKNPNCAHDKAAPHVDGDALQAHDYVLSMRNAAHVACCRMALQLLIARCTVVTSCEEATTTRHKKSREIIRLKNHTAR